ncbi:F-box protein CPR1-like [Papaver somniferum]|uniref:F-box protein CPR1-like n=1 Tax=Papaver somniferum TaxID=3469 RepID=UPI000E6FCA2E|nr:F-box protein CPR1-like [Papaver somniferum]
MFYEGDDIFAQFYMIDYKSVSALLPLSTSSSATICEFINNRMGFPTIFLHYQVDFLPACNGLVRVYLTPEKWGDAEFYIWNPSTKVYKNIPTAPDVDYEEIDEETDGHGFFYNYKIENYKLIRDVIKAVINRDSKCSNVDVYTLGSNSWRSIQGIPYHLYHKRAFEVIFHGALHWLALTFEKDFVLLRFNINNEIFEEVALPEVLMPYLEQPLEENTFGIDVAVLGGSPNASASSGDAAEMGHSLP